MTPSRRATPALEPARQPVHSQTGFLERWQGWEVVAVTLCMDGQALWPGPAATMLSVGVASSADLFADHLPMNEDAGW